MILELARLLKPITVAKMPLAKKPDRKNKIDHWAALKYWAEVEYRDITTDGLLRHTTFRGLYSQRRACGLAGLHPKTYRYASTRSDGSAMRIKLKAACSAGGSATAASACCWPGRASG